MKESRSKRGQRKGWATRKIKGREICLDVVEMAAAHTAGIVLDHPFIAENKRTGFVVGVLFLKLNGYRFVASEEAAAQAVLSLAAGTLEEDAFAAWMRANVKKR
jgi:death on curing protein